MVLDLMVTSAGGGMFSAICGSSLATAATMSKVSMPEMRRYKYDDSLATASIAAGGTLGILIPPSVMLVIYGFLTRESVGQLFIAGVLVLAGFLVQKIAFLGLFLNDRIMERAPWVEYNVQTPLVLAMLLTSSVYNESIPEDVARVPPARRPRRSPVDLAECHSQEHACTRKIMHPQDHAPT